MRLSQKTLQILKNFATINESLVFTEGNVLRTVSHSGTVMARAMIDVHIPDTFGIYRLADFLSAIAMMDDPELECTRNAVVMKSGKQMFRYVCSDPSMLKAPPQQEVVLPSKDVKFTMTSEAYSKIQKALGVMRAPEMLIRGDGSVISLEATDLSKGPSSSNYVLEVGETDLCFTMVLASENLKMMQGDYTVEICRKGIVQFGAPGIEYWIRANKNSSFG